MAAAGLRDVPAVRFLAGLFAAAVTVAVLASLWGDGAWAVHLHIHALPGAPFLSQMPLTITQHVPSLRRSPERGPRCAAPLWLGAWGRAAAPLPPPPLRSAAAGAPVLWAGVACASLAAAALVHASRRRPSPPGSQVLYATKTGSSYLPRRGKDPRRRKDVRPPAVIFDLDACIWEPDTWECTGAPFTQIGPTSCQCRGGETLRLLPAACEVLFLLRTDPQWQGTKVGVASCCCYPEWAQQFFDMFELGPNLKLREVWDMVVIQRGDKQAHLRKLSEGLQVPLSDMVFFDDCLGNCSSVAKLGVKAIHTPHGLTMEKWQEGLGRYSRSR